MADFNTHISTSTFVGVGVGVAGYFILDTPEPSRIITCMLGAGLCSLAGILPDLDSGSGRPLRETSNVLAAVVPMLMVDRWQHMGLTAEAIALAGALVYITIRFGVAEVFKRYTVHRGMWHSIPAAVSCGLLAFIVVSGENLDVRIFKSACVFIGFMVHLILDEIWSVEWKGARIRLKSSFGTAIKFWYGKNLWSNISTYGKLIILVVAAVGDPLLMEHYKFHPSHDPNQPQVQTQQIASEPQPTIQR
ncbi:metal-dependent hydrolase [Bremerella sp. T1]|uniref:metal-dependent hydrolase n=1 Tax=Bremerella sp. TYQ1 TaxID=3119568 RepID=UPI001CCE25B4|nr:metal-dependent hydrolase [Bremerella volcania]UBM38036.1 metal-dependent hydrolase [Bremerella volcania]